MHPALGRKIGARHPGTGPVMGGGPPHNVHPAPVRTVDKEWKDRVSAAPGTVLRVPNLNGTNNERINMNMLINN